MTHASCFTAYTMNKTFHVDTPVLALPMAQNFAPLAGKADVKKVREQLSDSVFSRQVLSSSIPISFFKGLELPFISY